MELKEMLNKTPNTVLAICGTVIVVAILGSITIVAVTGSKSDDVFRFLNVLFNVVSIVLGSGAFVYAGAAAKRGDDAAKSLNGDLDRRIRDAVRSALRERGSSRDRHSA